MIAAMEVFSDGSEQGGSKVVISYSVLAAHMEILLDLRQKASAFGFVPISSASQWSGLLHPAPGSAFDFSVPLSRLLSSSSSNDGTVMLSYLPVGPERSQRSALS